MSNPRELYVICGPNGSGKTTLINTFSKNIVEKKAIEIAPNPDDPTSSESSLNKQKFMLNFINDCLNRNLSVIFETTGAGYNSVANLMDKAYARNYRIIFWYLYLPNVQIPKERIQSRYTTRG
ncbi:MAG: ATP-binding cassette domain-containing protein [Parachlamydia sp.]|jgi:predicted ABC-type ATPase|nr:ATP-binding cassette domain-containing protein [Parachlamydia sp.]